MKSASELQGRACAAALATLLPVPSWAGTSSPIDLGGLVQGLLFWLIGGIALLLFGIRSRAARRAAFAWFVVPVFLVLVLIGFVWMRF